MNEHFKKVFVINRKSDVKRMNKTDKILRDVNINYTRFEAISFDNDVCHSRHITKHGISHSKYITDEILGCALSHINIWKLIVQNNIKSAVVFEDDIFLVKNWNKALNIALRELPHDWDIFTFGNTGIKNKIDKYDSPFNYLLYIFVNLLGIDNKKYDNEKYKNITIPYFYTGTYGYAISNSGARKLLSLIDDVNFHIDVLISCHSNYLNIYCMNKDIVYQRTEDSTLSIKKNKSNNFKIHLNLFDNLTDSKNVKYDYYMNIPVYKLEIKNKNIIINGWFLLILLILLIAIVIIKVSFKNFKV